MTKPKVSAANELLTTCSILLLLQIIGLVACVLLLARKITWPATLNVWTIFVAAASE